MVEQVDRDAAADLIERYWSGANASMMKLAASYRAGHSHGAFVRAFEAHRIAAEARGMEATFALIPEMGRKIEKERLREARSWGGPTMYTPLNLEELITAIRAALNGGQHE